MPETVRAAGAVLYRPAGGGLEVCVVHRPRYDDWSLPKGKLEGREHPLAGAVREVREETGWHARPEMRLRVVGYRLPDGAPKTVDFWLMAATTEEKVLDVEEVDRVEWMPLNAAAGRLTYPDDRALIDRVAALPPVTAVSALVRHAHAGERKKWSGNDALRPVDADGRKESERLAALCGLIAPQRLFAATPLRCKQTLEPLSGAAGVPIIIDNALAEPPDAADAPAKAKLGAQRLRELVAAGGGSLVACSQGKVIPDMIADLLGESDREPYKTPKGGGWLLTWSGDRLLSASRL